MFKMSKPVMYLLVATVAVAIYLLTSSSPSPTHTSKPLPKPLVSVTSTQYTQADRDANFPKAVLTSRDAFQPVVMRRSNLNAVLAAAGNIPAEMTGGDPNWACTGTDEVDGAEQVLFENKNTNDGVFLKQGDHWKQCVVSQILEDGVVLVGPSGEPKTIHVKQDTTTDQPDLSGNIPVEPQLNGAIGGDNSQAPALPSPNSNSQTDNNNAG